MAKANFETCLTVVLTHEGGYVDHPDDPGGATNHGITRRTLADWRGVSPWWALDKNAVKTLGQDETRAIYRDRYWDAVAGDQLPAGVDLAVFDFAVHSGPGRAVRLLQAELGVSVDGIAGPLTCRAADAVAEAGHARALVTRICDRRLGFLQSLSSFASFGRGWTRRVAETRARALSMCPPHQSNAKRDIDQMDILSGYRTYIVGAFMLVTAIAQMAGIDLPGLEGQSAMQLLMEGLAVVFLRKGMTAETS